MLSLVSDCSTRLTGGLAIALLAVPWRMIPPGYFRTLCLVVLGVSVVTALDVWIASPVIVMPRVLALAVCVAAYGGAIAWGLGLPRFGQAALVLVGLCSWFLQLCWGGVLGGTSVAVGLQIATRLASGFLLGSALSAMLLGHHYLIAPAMSTEPLKRLLLLTAAGLVLRGVLAGIALGLSRASAGLTAGPGASLELMLAMRWVLGLVAPAMGTALAWRSAAIRSTQSATGILYATITLLLLGELSSLVLARQEGVPY